MQLVGVNVHLRDVETFDVTAPAPVEPGDVVATAEHVYRVEDVLVFTEGPVVAALLRSIALPIAARCAS